MNETITIAMEEYKELLIIKGKYEELKSQQTIKPTLLYKEPTLTRDYGTPNITLCEYGANHQREENK